MKNFELAHDVLEAGMPRREFLCKSAMLAVPMVLGGSVLPAMASSYSPPVRSHSSATRSVKSYGAVGDGRHDDTAAFQAAINSLPSSGGTITVPAGTYLIDPVKKIQLRSYNHLSMSQDAVLKAKTNSATRAYLIYAYKRTQVEISGGRLVGDRSTHHYVSGSTSEWNHGIQILGCTHVTIRDLHVSSCAGDGICIGGGASDVRIANVVSTGNRRQGLSITHCHDVRVYDSEFSYTKGTSPECGIDIEPDGTSTAYDIRIENCRLNNNAMYGINVWKRVSNVTLNHCTIERNGSCGAVTSYCSAIHFTNNTVRYNSATGIFLREGSKSCTISGGTSYGNYTRLGTKTRSPFYLTGWASKVERDILLRSTSGTSIGKNYYK
ncbi:right-handed parallel beta-helix repeat-containing protein [Cognatiluteimonas telluris]|uniref:right-handed parallel beta-helix repeat-containing protein n=1 Tax=Cognatiluteimonas telluris TaxID=1104775 RepID=UPI00140B0F1E|nr:right-handed parallel beta-helix repeat-containing protein [Lysobacter telluris]